MNKKTFLFVLALAAALPLAAELKLAENGRTAYVIVPPENPSRIESQAVEDLALYLKRSTGAEFKVDANGHSPRIVVGRRAPGDNKALRLRERRIKSSGDDLYLYGGGTYGTAFAVYDFLDRFVGCRWFSCWGDEYVPKHPVLAIAEPNIEFMPSFAAVAAGNYWSIVEDNPGIRAFLRRNRIFPMGKYTGGTEGTAYKVIGPAAHGLAAWLPAGAFKPGTFQYGVNGPLPQFAECKYFRAHPEYFSLINGKRVPYKHFCFSNPGFRKEIAKNIKQVLKEEYRPGVETFLPLAPSDTGGPYCECEECKKLIDKYSTPGGAYFDWVNELALELKELYPELIVKISAYKTMMSGIPPVGLKFPDNVTVNYSPLYNDYSKSLDSPSNAKFKATFTEWSKHCSRLAYWIYPQPYALSSWCQPLLVGVRRLDGNLRLAHRLGTADISGEFGASPYVNGEFTELLLYAFARLGNDLSRDPNEIVKEFCTHCYGAAAEPMLKYINELENLAAADARYVWCTADQRILGYVTPQNLMRWQRDFDRMEALVKDDTRKLLNVRRARLSLDSVTIQCFRDIQRAFPEVKEDELDRIHRRYLDTVHDDYIDMYRYAEGDPEKRFRDKYSSMRRLQSGVNLFYAEAKGGKPLPPEFKPMGKIFCVRPDQTQSIPERDEKGAYGIGITLAKNAAAAPATIEYRDEDCRVVQLRPRLMTPEELQKLGTEYAPHYLGSARLTPDALIKIKAKKYRIDFYLGHLFDPAEPDRSFDFYLSVRKNARGGIVTDRLIAVKTPVAGDIIPVQ